MSAKSKDEISTGLLIDENVLKHIDIPEDVFDIFFARDVAKESLPNEPCGPFDDEHHEIESDSFLIVIFPKRGRLKLLVFPSGKEVVKIILSLYDFSAETAKSLASVINTLKLPSIHSSGLCFGTEHCVYELYVDKTKLPLPLEEILSALKEVNGVNKVYHRQISLKAIR